MMDARQARRNDPFGTDHSSYCNWPSPSARRANSKILNEQRASIERLSRSPEKGTREYADSAELLLKHKSQTPVKITSAEKEQFFASRNAGQGNT